MNSILEDGNFVASSMDQKSRIDARGRRIDARNISTMDDSGQKKKLESTKLEMGAGQQQITSSLSTLDNNKLSTVADVSSVRVSADRRENVRRIIEEDKRQERLRRLQEEAYNSGKHNAAVDMKWAELMEENMPQELMKEITKQRAACSAIISSKDQLIQEFQAELKSKDESYVKTLKNQSDDITALLDKMTSQYKLMQTNYESEIEAIEMAFLQERDKLLKSNRSELDNLFEQRRKMELNYMEAKSKREEGYIAEIEKIRIEDAEKFNKLKIRLESDIQTLEQQLEEMRATYQLNTEKLEYNYRVLTERDHEHSATLNQQKRKENRLKDALTGYIARYNEMDVGYKSHNTELTEEYRRITKQYKDLQKKFRHFEIADNKQYHDIWMLHESEVSEAVKKVLKADEVIHQQQLGWTWVPPREDPLRPTSVNLKKGSKHSNAKNNSNNDHNNATPSKDAATTNATTGVNSNIDTTNPAGKELPPNDSESEAMKLLEAEKSEVISKVKNVKVRHMLQLLSSEAGFLIEPSARESMDSMTPEEASIFEADAILKALNVNTEDEVNRLLSYFFISVSEEEEVAMGKHVQDVKSLKLKVSSDEVIKTVKKYIEDRDSLEASVSASKSDAAAEATLERQEDARLSEEIFWKKMSTVISGKTLRVWEALEDGLMKYNKLLNQRSGLLNDVSSLQSQNSELKSLLSQYLAAPVNDELHIPPTKVIQIEK